MGLRKVEVNKEVFEIPDEWSVKYNYHYGRLSPFFRTLKEEGKLLATKCPKCGWVACPPRPDCPQCFVSADWMETSGEGTIDTFCITYLAIAGLQKQVPYCLAYVNLDSTDTAILQCVTGIEFEKIKIGMRVRVKFNDKDKREGKITDFEFVPI